MTESTTTEGGSKQTAGAAVLVFALVWAVFARTGAFDFVNFDDPDYVTANPMVQGGLSWDAVRLAFTTFHAGHWHPLTWLSHMLDVSLFGLDAGKHHLVNVGLHAVNAALFVALLRRFGLGVATSLFLAVVFAIHPLRVESVAWVTGRKDMLSMLFLLLALHAYVSSTKRRAYGIVVAAGFAFALMSKPIVITLPVILLLVDYWPLARSAGWKTLVVEKIPLFALSLTSAVITLSSQDAAGALVSASSTGLGPRVANALTSTVGYVGLLVWPWDLGPFYPLRPVAPAAAAASALVIAAITAWAFRERRRAPFFVVGWLWFLVALAPVIGIVQVGGQAMADRYAFIPSIGLSIAIVLGVSQRVTNHDVRRILAGAATVAMLGLTVAQTGYWRDSETLWRHTVDAVPDNFMAETNLGVALSARGADDEAMVHFEEAVRLHPRWPTAQNNLGNAKGKRGLYDEAARHFEAALAVAPDFHVARYNLGLTYAFRGKNAEAEREFRAVLEQRPDYAPARESLEQLRR